MKLTDAQIEKVLKIMEINNTPKSELFKEFDSDPDRVITEYYNANVDVVFSEIEPSLGTHTSKMLSYFNRYNETLDLPEIHMWDLSRKFLKRDLKIQNYSFLKYIVNQISYEIASELIQTGEAYDLPNSIGLMVPDTSEKGSKITELSKSYILSKVSKIRFKNKIKHRRFSFKTRNRYRLLCMYHVLNKKNRSEGK